MNIVIKRDITRTTDSIAHTYSKTRILTCIVKKRNVGVVLVGARLSYDLVLSV